MRSVQSSRGRPLKEPGTGLEGVIIGPPGIPRAIVKNVVPDKHFPANAGLRKQIPCAVAAREMKCSGFGGHALAIYPHRLGLMPGASDFIPAGLLG